MSLRSHLDKLRANAETIASKVRENNKPAIQAARLQAAKIRENLGLSEPITTAAVMSVVGPAAVSVHSDDAAEIRTRFGLEASVELSPGDVVWAIHPGNETAASLCIVRVSMKQGSIHLQKTPSGKSAHEGSVSILDGRLLLHSDNADVDMKTGRPLR